MRILLLHQNFPGQYAHIAKWAQETPGVDVMAITDTKNKRPDTIPTVRYPEPGEPLQTPFGSVKRFQEAVYRGEAAAKAAVALRQKGFVPDLVLGHGAWGETFYMREVFPGAKVISYAEFYYRPRGFNIGFDPEFDSVGPDVVRTVDAQNAVMSTSVLTSDHCHAPTLFQASSFPDELRSKIGVVFDGIDTDVIKPNPMATLTLPNGLTVRPGDPVVTFINRNFEPYRGYHIFMRALPKILSDNPKAQIIMIGGDGVSYGAAAPAGKTWKDIFLNEVKDRIDLSRVHFPGRVPHATLRTCYEVSAAHVYLTYPFVLSWSMLEAMAAGCLIIGADVAPVREMITHGLDGVLTPFFDPDALAARVGEALQDPARFEPLRAAARAKVQARYDLRRVCLPAQLDLYDRVLRGGGLGQRAADVMLAQ